MWNWITRLFHRKSYDERNKPLPPLPPSSPTLVLGDATTRVPSQHGIGPEYFTTNTTFNPQRINVPGATQNPTVRNNSNAAYSIPQRPSQTIQDQQYSLYPRSQVQFSDSMQWTYPDYHYQPPLNDPRFNFNHIYPHGPLILISSTTRVTCTWCQSSPDSSPIRISTLSNVSPTIIEGSRRYLT
ncbi:hypothetical protein H0H93_016740 [Arthromyces matolae]|nr:hypothetical protein H0H93_016740 [Arthromyces matolae]